jgi:hypothetical protein
MKFLVEDCGGTERFSDRSSSIQYTYEGIRDTPIDDQLIFDMKKSLNEMDFEVSEQHSARESNRYKVEALLLDSSSDAK